jgi:uncharacterized membrane protein
MDNLESSGKGRVASIDVLRGFVIIFMILDHTREFFGAGGMNPRDTSAPLLFLTRWISHFCAPVFVLLAGVSVWLYLQNHDRLMITRIYLLIRGFWLIFLELTLICFFWSFDWTFKLVILQVIWVFGFGFVALSFLVGFPSGILAAIGGTMMVMNDRLQPLSSPWISDKLSDILFTLLSKPDHFFLPSGIEVLVLYPLIPWVGLMVFGFGLGPLFTPKSYNPKIFVALGIYFISFFLILRLTGMDGDTKHWLNQESILRSILSFIDCEKYPPSLQFFLMTLGPTFLLYPLITFLHRKLASVLQTFGRVPMFVYVTHLPLLHGLALFSALAMNSDYRWLLSGFPPFSKPDGYGASLLVVDIIWFAMLLALYYPCRFYTEHKIFSIKP